jgi:DNA mismatch endonuclease (patch repair protein)
MSQPTNGSSRSPQGRSIPTRRVRTYGGIVRGGGDQVDPVVSARMRAVRCRDTRPEMRLRSELHRLGLRYRVNRRPIPALRRTGDVVFGAARVVVMVDGCFWHGCSRHMRPSSRNRVFWANKIAENQRRDRETDRELTEAGWTVIRIWEHEDPSSAAARVAAVVSALRR